MIEVELVFQKKGGGEILRELKSKGHSSYQEKELCASLSTLEYTFFYSLKSLTQARFDHEIREGFFKIVLLSIDKKDELIYNHLSSFYLVGLKTLEASHRDVLFLKEVR